MALSFRAKSRNLLLLFDRGLREFHRFSLLNFPRRIQQRLLAFKQAPTILVLFGKTKVATLREAWRLEVLDPLFLRASNYWAISWLISIDPSGRARRNNLYRDVHRRDVALITHQVYIAAAYVGEALAGVVDDRRAVGTVSFVHRELSSYNRDKARTRVRVPSSVLPGLERVPRDINVGISLDLRLEVPPV
jgi:hypothetical protein